MCYMRNAIEPDLQGNRYLLLDLFRGDSRPLGYDLDVVIRNVRIGFDRKCMKCDDTGAKKEQRERHHKEPIGKGKIDNSANHFIYRPYPVARVRSPQLGR